MYGKNLDLVSLEQDKLIVELNHTLVSTQEKLEQQVFMLDEKEIEIMEKDELVNELREKLTTVELFSASQKATNADLMAKLDQEAAENQNWSLKLKCKGRSIIAVNTQATRILIDGCKRVTKSFKFV